MSVEKKYTQTGEIVPSHYTEVYKDRSASLNVDFILSHLSGPLFPRNIMTNRLGYQVEVLTLESMLRHFEWSDYQDCRIAAYPLLTNHNGLNLVSPSLVMIDLDLNNFKSEIALDKVLKSILDRIYGLLKFKPTVLWTGNGYHIYLPIKAFVLEEEQLFASFVEPGEPDLSTKFMRFAEQFFTNGKHDQQHKPSVNNCLLRVPGTFNSKNRQQVKIIQEWDRQRAAIQYMLRDFRCYLIQERLDRINASKKMVNVANLHQSYATSQIQWIERLLRTPIEDYRKYCVWRVLAPYLVNVRRLSEEDSCTILLEWLHRCHEIKRLSFYPRQRVRDNVRRAKKRGYLPVSLNSLQKENAELYRHLLSLG